MKIILITGGQRSGKSAYAERLALSLSPNPVYMATAHVWDDDFRERIRIHQARRGDCWTNIEEERYLSNHDVTGRVVLIDCCTLWATNFFFPPEEAPVPAESAPVPAKSASGSSPSSLIVPGESATVPGAFPATVPGAFPPGSTPPLSLLTAEFDRFTAQDATFIFVTNEIGLGGTSANAVQRRFTDLLGSLNQYIASKANEVTLLISGIPVKIK